MLLYCLDTDSQRKPVMRKVVLSSVAIISALLLITGCSDSPVELENTPGTQLVNSPSAESSNTHLWGLYDVSIDLETQTASIIPNRQAMFTANVVNFVNSNPTNLSVTVNGVIPGIDHVDVDLNVKLRHPFTGMPMYSGYDVRGVFMGDGSAVLGYNSDLVRPVEGTDQIMLSGPVAGYSDPDGYTRWFNYDEFPLSTMPLFTYTQGNMATPGFAGTSTLCPYRYFSDDLDPEEDLWQWLDGNASQRGVFSSGAVNERKYYIRFPNSKGTVFGYAITANWEGEDLTEDHPSNTPEAVACDVVDNSDVYYIDPTENGGNLDLDFSLFNWDHQPSTIYIESSVLSSVEVIDPLLAAIGGGDHYSTYHVEIPADGVTGNDGNEYWIIAEYEEFDYKNDFGVPNNVGNDLLAAFFRYYLFVADEITNNPPVCDVVVVTTMPYEGWAKLIEFDASGSSDPDPGDILSFSWDFDNDGNFDDSYEAGTPENPKKYFGSDYNDVVCVRVSDGNGGETECCTEVLDITAYPTKNIDVTFTGREALDLCIDHTNGDLMVLYENGMARRYDYSAYYQSSTDIPTNHQQGALADRIDMDENGYWMVPYYYNAGSLHFFRSNHYSPFDVYQTVTHWLVYYPTLLLPGIIDAVCMYDAGVRANTHVYPLGYNSGSAYFSRIYGRGYPPTWSSYVWWCDTITGSSPSYGCSDYCWGLIVGGEADPTGDFIWFVEEDDRVAARWDVGVSGLSYEGPCFGTSQSPITGQDGLWEPLDITVDDQGYMYVMDKVADSPAEFSIKAFSYDDSSTTSFENFGDSDDWDLDPIRIDGSQFNGHVVVLQSDGTDAKVSVFTEEETP